MVYTDQVERGSGIEYLIKLSWMKRRCVYSEYIRRNKKFHLIDVLKSLDDA